MAVHVVLLTDRRLSFDTINSIQTEQRYPLTFIYQVAPELDSSVEKAINDQHLTNFYLVRDQLCTVFAPRWMECPTVYIPLQQLAHNDQWTVFICDEDTAKDIDYYANLSSFEHKRVAVLTDDLDQLVIDSILDIQAIRGETATGTGVTQPIRSPLILSHWTGSSGFTETALEVIRHGIRHLRCFLAAGFHETSLNNPARLGPFPGWCVQEGSHWLTRFYNVYKVVPFFCREDFTMESYTTETVEKGMRDYYHKTLPDIPRDNRMETVETCMFRLLMVEGTMKALVAILHPLGRITPELVSAHGGWTSLSLWEAVQF